MDPLFGKGSAPQRAEYVWTSPIGWAELASGVRCSWGKKRIKM